MTRFEGFGPKVQKWVKGLEAEAGLELRRGAEPVTGWLDEHVGASTLPRDRPGRGR
jgi:hypothetical protein